MKNLKNNSINLLIFLCLSIFAHAKVIYEWYTKGIYFTGKGDGIAQMIPFQSYLYEKYTSGQFFYSMDFGIGGDFSKSLAYYYATSPVSIFNFISIWIGDLFFKFNTSDPTFWLSNQIFISILKLTIIFFIMYKLLRYLKINKYISIIGSFLYGWSTVYYFFTFTWSFFSDVMIWLPLTIWGIEKIIREKKPLMFILAIALTLHSNFYFGYYEFIFILFYFIYRVLYENKTDIINRFEKIKIITISAVLGLMISSVGFITGIIGFLENDRSLPPLKLKPFIDIVVHYNLFYDSYYVVIPFITILALMSFKLYEYYYFKLFATISILFMVGSLSPLFDSFFNGFSIDQRRWQYMLVFATSIVISLYLENIKEINLKSFIVSIIPAIIILPLSVYGHHYTASWLVFIIPTIILIYLSKKFKDDNIFMVIFTTLIILMQYVFVNNYVDRQIKTLHPDDEHNKSYIQSKAYNSKTQNDIINNLKNNSKSTTRIDWQTSATHNTPMYQHFNGIKLYSSIFNKDIFKFYDKDLNIGQETDSNSIYYRLGERANLYSLFGVNYIIRNNESQTKPYGFEKIDQKLEDDGESQYYIYENKHKLPFIKVTSNVFSEKDLKNAIDKEHAMLKGVVLKNNKLKNSNIKLSENLLNKTTIQNNQSSLTNGKLIVNADNGGMIYNLPKNISKKYKDLYVNISVELKTPSKYHHVWINEIYQARKPLDDDYRRVTDKIILKIKSQSRIEVKLLSGEYNYKINGIYGENYQYLKNESNKKDPGHTYKEVRNNIKIKLKDHKAGYAVIPIPYLKGMKAYSDGNELDVQEGNYLMTAIKVKESDKDITLKYRPPYLLITQIISILGIIFTILFIKYQRKFYSKE